MIASWNDAHSLHRSELLPFKLEIITGEISTGALYMSSTGRFCRDHIWLGTKRREPIVPLVGCCDFPIGSGAREDPGFPHMVGGLDWSLGRDLYRCL